MKKYAKYIVFTLLLCMTIGGVGNYTTKAAEQMEEPIIIIDNGEIPKSDAEMENDNIIARVKLEGVEFTSGEEAMTYLEQYLGKSEGTLQFLAQVRSAKMQNEMSAIHTTNSIKINYITSSAYDCSEIGVRSLSIQSRKPDSLLYYNRPMGSFSEYNSSFYGGGFEWTEPEVGLVYRVKGTHFAVIDGVEYSFDMVTNSMTFTGK